MLKRCEFIRGRTISYDDEHRIVVIDNRALHFGANHYLILSLLLTNQEVGDNALSLALYQQKAHAGSRELMRKTISKLRARLKTFDLDIKRIHDEGYRLVTLARTSGSGSDRQKALPSQSFLLRGQCFGYLGGRELNARDAIGRLAEVAGDILIQPDMVNHHACAGDGGNLALQQILHGIVGHVAVEAHDAVFDQHREIVRTLELTGSLQIIDHRIHRVQQFVLGHQEVHHVEHARHLTQVGLNLFLLRLQLDLAVERKHYA